MVEAKPSLPSPPPPAPRVIDLRARKLAVEFSTLAAKEIDPERRRDFRELAKLHWKDAYGRPRRYWHPAGRGDGSDKYTAPGRQAHSGEQGLQDRARVELPKPTMPSAPTPTPANVINLMDVLNRASALPRERE